MSTKHTPGPWAAEAAMSSDTPHIRYITADGAIIASVRHRLEQTQDEALANARLMAAAPELAAGLSFAANAYATSRGWASIYAPEARLDPVAQALRSTLSLID